MKYIKMFKFQFEADFLNFYVSIYLFIYTYVSIYQYIPLAVNNL